MGKYYINKDTGETGFQLTPGGKIFPVPDYNQQGAEGTGNIEALWQGLGKFGHDVQRNIGLRDNALGDTSASDAAARAENPIMFRAGEYGPAFVGGGAYRGASILGKVAAATANTGIDAGLNVLSGDPDQSWQERAAWGAGGRVAGDMSARILGRLWGGMKGAAGDMPVGNAAQNRMAQRFAARGGQLNPGMVGGVAEGNLASRMETGRFTSRLFDPAIEANQRIFARDAATLAGLKPSDMRDIDRFTYDDLTTAFTENGKGFDKIADRIDEITLPEKFQRWLSDDARELLRRKGVEVADEGPITIPGKHLTRIRSRLLKKKTQEYKSGDADAGELLGDDMDDLDDIVEELVPGGLKQDYARVREQYRILKGMEGIGNYDDAGLRPMKNLWNKLKPLQTRGVGGERMDNMMDTLGTLSTSSMKTPYSPSGRSTQGGPIKGLLNLAELPFAKDRMRTGKTSVIDRFAKGLGEADPSTALIRTGQRVGRVAVPGLLEEYRGR